jgi:hypothetical protein
VDDAAAVRLLEHVAELHDDAFRPIERHGDAALQELVEALPDDILHLDVGDVARRARVVDGHRVHVGEEGHRPGLPTEPRPHLGVVLGAQRDQLQRPLDAELEVADEPDLAHGPLAQLPQHVILAEPDVPRLGRAGIQTFAGR